MKRIAHALALLFAVPLTLTTLHTPDVMAAEQKPAPTTDMTDGEVRRIDKEAKKITIRHGPIHNLGMPGMTMAFQVKDPAMLDKVSSGDKIKFWVEKIGGAYTVTEIELAK